MGRGEDLNDRGIGQILSYPDQSMSERFSAEKLNRYKMTIHNLLSKPQRYDQQVVPVVTVKFKIEMCDMF